MGKISEDLRNKCKRQAEDLFYFFVQSDYDKVLQQKTNSTEDPSKDSNVLTQKINSREDSGEDSNVLSEKINSEEDSNVLSQKINLRENLNTLSQKRNSSKDSSKDSNLLSQKMNSRENTGEESNFLSQKINSGEDSGGYSNVLSQKISTKVKKKIMKNNKKSKKTFSRNIFKCYLSQKRNTSEDSGEDSNVLSQKINSREDSILPNTNLPKKLTRPKLTCRLICYTSPTSSPKCLSFEEDLSFKGDGDYDDKEDDKDDVVVDLTYNLQNQCARYQVALKGPTQEEIKEAAIKLEWVGDEIQKEFDVEKILVRYITDSPKLDYNSFAAYLDRFIGKSKDVDDFILFLNISKRVITETQSFGTKTFKYIRRFVGSAFADNIAQKNNVVEFVSQRINN